MAVVVFSFTFPVLAYYQAGFVPSAPALSTAFIAYYFYFKNVKHKDNVSFYLAIGLMLAAALYRSPFNIFLFAILLNELWNAFNSRKILWQRFSVMGIAYLLLFAFQVYKKYLKEEFGSMFLTELMPARSVDEFVNIIETVWLNWSMSYFTWAHYILLLLALVGLLYAVLVKKQKIDFDSGLPVQVFLCLGGAFLYFLLMARQFPDHDYYFIDTFYLGFILFFILGLQFITTNSRGIQLVFNSALFLLLVWASHSAAGIQRYRYTFNFWDFGEITHQNFVGSAEFLDSLGIGRDATVLVLDAYSTNAPLILMERRGYTVQHTLKENIQSGIKEGADYIVIQDELLPTGVILNYPELTQHLNKIDGNGRITVYTYSENEIDQTLEDLLWNDVSLTVDPLDFNSKDSTSLWSHTLPAAEDHKALLPGSELFGPIWEFNGDSDFKRLLLKANFLSKSIVSRFEAVLSIVQHDQVIFYRSFPIDFSEADTWEDFMCMFVLPGNLDGEVQLKCNLYNPNGAEVWMKDISITY